MADPDLAALSRLVGDVDDFAERHWGHRSLLRPSGEDFRDLISVASIEEMLLSGSRHPSFRLVRDGSPLPPQRSTATVRLGGRPVDDVADLARIAGEVADGATLVMQGLQRTSIEVAQLCRRLERATSHPVQANAYLSPPDASGLAAHADDHDVLVVQVIGSKCWQVADLGEVLTHPGDVLYLPAGVRHSASTQRTSSLHLTIGIVRVTRGDALRRALTTVAGEDLAGPLPLGFARPERVDVLADALAEAVSAASGALRTLDLRAAADAEQQRAARRRRALPVGQLSSVLGLSSLQTGSRVRRRPDALATLSAGPSDDGRREEVVLTLADRRLRLPAAMGPAVDALLRGADVEIGALPGLDEGSQLVLVRRLVREGLVVVVDA